jgi:hypothetical protein
MTKGAYKFREFYIPEHMFFALRRYVVEHRNVGGFLTAIIQNNLRESVALADEENIQNLPAYVNYLYNECPAECWGSKEKMEKWLALAEDNPERNDT